SVLLIGGRAQYFVGLFFRIGAVLIEFAEHCLGFRLVGVGRVFQTLKTIGLEREDLIEIVFGKDFVIDGAVVGRVGVIVSAGAFENLVPLISGVVLAAAKHEVLEEVSVT